MWTALFQAIKSAFDFASKLVSRKTEPTTEADAYKQRAGTEAGAAATHAGRIAGGSNHGSKTGSEGNHTS